MKRRGTARMAGAVGLMLLGGCADRGVSNGPGVAPSAAPLMNSSPAAPAPPRAPATPPSPAPPTIPPADVSVSDVKAIFPGVRFSRSAKWVEFDATVPLNAKDPQRPRQYLEAIACTPDTKEHEAVLLTKAKPSQVHAALLLIGLEPGSPGVWNWEGEALQTVPPKGPRVRVTAVYRSGEKTVEVNPAEWVVDATTGKTLAQSEPEGGWVFAGSQVSKRQGQDHYRADVDGTLIGLHTFGGETLAWTRMYNPDSGVEEPRWIANAVTLPPYDTGVVVRITRAE